MKQRNLFVTIALFVLVSTVALALSQPLLVVKESPAKKGYTYLALIVSPGLEEVRLTEDMFQISFPRVCEKTGMIGFTHHTAAMKAEIYLIQGERRSHSRRLFSGWKNPVVYECLRVAFSLGHGDPNAAGNPFDLRTCRQLCHMVSGRAMDRVFGVNLFRKKRSVPSEMV